MTSESDPARQTQQTTEAGGSPQVLVAQLDPGYPPGRLGEWLADGGAAVRVRTADQIGIGEALDSDGLVVLGGRPRPSDGATEVGREAVGAAIAAALQRGTPVLGIGEGAHLLAAAAGGRVGAGDEGPEYGAQLVAKRTAAAGDPLLREVPITPDVVQWHCDAVVALPPGSTLLASSPSYENQAFRVGRLAWGLQFHIESTRESVGQWVLDDRAALEEYDVPRLLERVASVEDDLAETWAPVASAFVEITRDPSAVDPAPSATVATAAPIMDPAQIRAALAAEAHASRGGPVPLSLPTLRPEENS